MIRDNLYSPETNALFDKLANKVTRKHCAELAASAISPDVAALRGYTSIDRKAASSLRLGYGFADYQAGCAPGLLLPTWDVFGKQTGAMFKPDNPRTRTKANGRQQVVKYEQPAGSRLIIDAPPICRPDLDKLSVDLWITEGIKKGDSLASHGRCAIALTGGVWGWICTSADGAKVALPDWREIALNGRRIFIAYDSDAITKPEVMKAERELAAYLTSRGAKVFIVRIPAPQDEQDEVA
jgi:hypothetical protein